MCYDENDGSCELHKEGSSAIECNQLPVRSQRMVILNLLYAADSYDYQNSLESVIDNFSRGFNINIPKDSYVFTTTAQIVDKREALEQSFIPFIDNWRIDRIGLVTRLILRFAIWELQYTDTPEIVVINEAIELAKSFAEKDAYKFVNGVLDEYIKKNKK